MRDGSAGEVFRPTFDGDSSGMRTEILEGGYEREEESKEFFTGEQAVYRDFRKGLVKISGMSANGRGSERSFEQFDRLMSHGIADQIKSNPNKDIVDMFRCYNDVYVENEDGSTRRPSVGYNASLRHETGFIRDDDRIVSNFLHGIRTYRFQYAKSRREDNPGSTQELAPIRLNRGKMNELFGQLIEKVQQRYEKHVHDKADEEIQKEDIEMMQRLIANMAYMGDRDTIDSVLELVAKYHDIDTRGVEYALSAVDAAYAAQQTIKKIREPRKDDESLDSYNSRVEKFSLIAYKIELGKVGVTDGVVKYLEQKFVLQGKEVDDITSARRVTGDGKMGLFDMDGGILGYFEIGDLSKSDVERHVHILEVTRDLLFSDPNTPDAVRQEFLENYTLFYENIFGEKMGVRMSDLTLREQVWMYQYWEKECNKETNGKKWQATIDLKSEYGVEGVKTFIASEFDSAIAGNIFQVIENTKEAGGYERKRELELFFRNYAQIIEVAENFYTSIFPTLQERYPNVFEGNIFFSKMMKRSSEFLRNTIQELLENPDIQYEDILQKFKSEHRAIDPQSCADAIVAQAVIEMINCVGDVETRAVLDEVHTQTQNPDVRKSINMAYGFTIPDIKDAEAIKSLEVLYGEKIQFETYKLNEQMNQEELIFLSDRLSIDDRILDLGFGTGRLLLPLKSNGFHVSGLDYVGRHVNMIKEIDPRLDVFQADWKDTKLPPESQDVVYSLGRNILHEYTLDGQHTLFSEVNRILPVGGQFIFDIPDRTRGQYRKLVDGYAQVMKERGIEHSREGTIYDSPDGKIFMTRYAYSQEDVLQLAEANGFAVESVEEKELPTGEGDVNIYFTLRKIESVDLSMQLARAA